MEKKLPIHEVLDELEIAIGDYNEVVLQAPPGAGKTTIVPLKFLGHPCLQDLKILVLEPRRIAARNAAARMAALINEEVGGTVGYRMRLDTKVGKSTKIEVITDGILLRMLHSDPTLSDVGMIIFDEFHERGLDSDLGLSLALKANELFRQTPMKLLFMSATLEDDRLSAFLGNAPLIRSQGRTWPVDIKYLGAAKPKERIGDRMVKALTSLMGQHPTASILAFLPGEGEIRFVESELSRNLNIRSNSDITTRISPLYGNLSLDAQRLATAPVTQAERKIVLATNIAETSLTIEGINIVLDSGLERQSRFDPNTAMSRLTTQSISQASATQRAGRAGRTGPGICYRLWSEQQQTQLALQGTPEILLADLSSLALQVLSWGLDDASDLRWLDPPPIGAWQQAIDQLVSFGAVEKKGAAMLLTPHGEHMAKLPLPPRIAHMLVHAAMLGDANLGCMLAALFTERDPLAQTQAAITDRIDILLRRAPCPRQFGSWLNRAEQLSAQYQTHLNSLSIQQSMEIQDFEQRIAILVALAFPDRIARKRHAGGYQLANGRSATLADGDRLNKSKWLAVAEVSGRKGTADIIRSGVSLNAAAFDHALSNLKTSRKLVEWDKKTSRFVAEQQLLIGHLVLERNPLDSIPAKEQTEAICQYIRSQGLAIFKKHASYLALQARCRHMFKVGTALEYRLEEDHLLDTLEGWLAPYLENASKLEQIVKIDISKLLYERMSYQQKQAFQDKIPTHFTVPTGSKIAINYLEDTPVLAVKLQEMFGCDDTPTIADGTIKLKVHLLSPAGRPLQVTQDLAGFWRSSYQAVRKEMRGRYPKHPWPEDPTVAIPTKKTKSKTG